MVSITFMVNFYYIYGWYYIYGFYYIYGWYSDYDVNPMVGLIPQNACLLCFLFTQCSRDFFNFITVHAGTAQK